MKKQCIFCPPKYVIGHIFTKLECLHMHNYTSIWSLILNYFHIGQHTQTLYGTHNAYFEFK